MSWVADKADPELWAKVKEEVTENDKGGRPGQWSARKAQLAVEEYKKHGGGYKGRKSSDNHLRQWAEEDWGTKSGRPSGETGERYLPGKAREHLTADEYRRTTAKKRRDTRAGKQFSAQPAGIAEKTARDRNTGTRKAGFGPSKADLMRRARAKGVPGRSKMTKPKLQKALAAGG